MVIYVSCCLKSREKDGKLHFSFIFLLIQLVLKYFPQMTNRVFCFDVSLFTILPVLFSPFSIKHTTGTRYFLRNFVLIHLIFVMFPLKSLIRGVNALQVTKIWQNTG